MKELGRALYVVFWGCMLGLGVSLLLMPVMP